MTSSVSIAKRKGFVKTPDGHIHYWAVGSREPVLLLHQSPRSVDEYVEVADILSSSKHVIALDALGYGNSDKPPRPYFIEDYARSVVTVMDALELEKASIVGQTFGGLIAAEIAATYPQRVSNLVLFNVFEFNAVARRDLAALEPWRVKDDGSHLHGMWQYAMARIKDPQIAHRLVVDLLKASESTKHGHRAVAEYRPERRWSQIQCPTLLVWGQREMKRLDERGWNTSDATNRMAKAIRNGSASVIPDGGVMFSLEMPGKFAQLVADFLESRRSDKRGPTGVTRKLIRVDRRRK